MGHQPPRAGTPPSRQHPRCVSPRCPVPLPAPQAHVGMCWHRVTGGEHAMERSHLGGSGYHRLVTSIPARMLGSPRLRVPPWPTSRGGLAPGDSVGYVPTQPPHCQHRGHARGPASRRRSRSRPRGPRRAAGMCRAHGAMSPTFPGPRHTGTPVPATHLRASPLGATSGLAPPAQTRRRVPAATSRLSRGKNRFRQAGGGLTGGPGGTGLNSRPRAGGSRPDARRASVPRRPDVRAAPSPARNPPPIPLTVHRQATGDGRRPSLPDVAGVGGGRSRRGPRLPGPVAG